MTKKKTVVSDSTQSELDSEQPTHMYRYSVHEFNDKVSLHLDEYPIIKETPCGYWIALDVSGWNMFQNYDKYCSRTWTKKKWVNKNAGVKWAWETKEQALIHLRHRQRKYKQILEHRLKRCTTALAVLDEQIAAGPEHPVTHWMGREIELLKFDS